jgi:aminoglycoside phosphotransferase (APT) family kinase protein
MLDHGSPSRLVAILDWEMATVGDPADRPRTASATGRKRMIREILSGALPRVTTLPGWLKRDDLIERYASAKWT